MHRRGQRTISRPVESTGIGFVTGRDVTVRFLPADIDEGITFRRTDVPGSRAIPARIEFAIPRRRRTAIARDGVVVEMTEHVMAALAGLQVDNCVVELDGPEPPGCDGSSLVFAEMLLSAGFVEQAAPRELYVVDAPAEVREGTAIEIACRPVARPTLAITYHLDYGPRSPIPAQQLTVEITPEIFLEQLAYSRTFVLAEEVPALRAAGYGARTTPKDLLVFGPHGPIDNTLRAADECVRHKILDCLGDFALMGRDIQGHFCAYRSGHHLNREMIRTLVARKEHGGHALHPAA
jgi:UDP-3-O-acyl N-acetylglucosamine deacetylase